MPTLEFFFGIYPRENHWKRSILALFAILGSLALVVVACGNSESPAPTTARTSLSGATAPAPQPSTAIVLGAYTTPREVYGRFIIPGFQKLWKETANQEVKFEESYQGSGAQSRAIIAGFDADVAALSLENDVANIAKAGLIRHNWQAKDNGIISRSVVVLAVRKGNPKGIKGWADLTRPGIEILTPDPRTSGGAQWNISAVWGATLRGKIEGVPANDPGAAQAFLSRVLKNVKVFDKGARESIENFGNGIGDVAITYENEVITAQRAGKDFDYVIPESTIVIENPAALIDASVNKHHNRDVVEAFIEYLHSPDVQRAFAQEGYRPKDTALLPQFASRYPASADSWEITYLGGWPKVVRDLFSDNGYYANALASR